MREEISNYQRKLRLSNNLMEIYPNIVTNTHEEFLLELLKKYMKIGRKKGESEILTMQDFL